MEFNSSYRLLQLNTNIQLLQPPPIRISNQPTTPIHKPSRNSQTANCTIKNILYHCGKYERKTPKEYNLKTPQSHGSGKQEKTENLEMKNFLSPIQLNPKWLSLWLWSFMLVLLPLISSHKQLNKRMIIVGIKRSY